MQHINNDPSSAQPLKKKIASQTLDELHREAELGKREDFEQFLKLVPDVPAQAGDEFFEQSTEQQRGKAPCQN